MQISEMRPGEEKRLEEITREAFNGVCIEQNIDHLLGQLSPLAWDDRKAINLAADFAEPSCVTLVAREDEEPIGYATVWLNERALVGWIHNLAVAEGRRGKGIGKELIDAALDLMRRRGMRVARIETITQNEVGQHLYAKMGFREVAHQILYAMPL